MDYEFVIAGRLSHGIIAELPAFTARFDAGRTRLRGVVRDGAELDGVAARLRDAGYRIVAMAPLDAGSTSPSSEEHPG